MRLGKNRSITDRCDGLLLAGERDREREGQSSIRRLERTSAKLRNRRTKEAKKRETRCTRYLIYTDIASRVSARSRPRPEQMFAPCCRGQIVEGSRTESRRSRFLFALRLSRDKRSKRRQTSPRSAASTVSGWGRVIAFRKFAPESQEFLSARSTCTLIMHYLNGDVLYARMLLSRSKLACLRSRLVANTVTKHRSPIVSSTSLRGKLRNR